MELKTKRTDASVDTFLAALDSDARRADCELVSELIQRGVEATT
ncbi:MAG: hypothetical protein NTX57_01805 [Armatimonadetes bacterium]|jgi:hypothetical protein|nr:hypothetical protein [Armatimonadota bacterium]